MGRLTQQDIERLHGRDKDRSRDGGNILGTAWRGLDRAVRLGGLGVGTAVGAVGEAIPWVKKWTPDVYSSTPEAFSAFWEQVKQGDWDAGIEAYQDEMGAGKGFWGAAEIAGAILPTGLPAMAGTRLISAATKLARTLGKVLPATRGGVSARRGIETGTKWLGKGLRAPWEAEELVGRTAMKGVGLGARSIRHPMTGPLARTISHPRYRRRYVGGPLASAVGRLRPDQAPTPPIMPAAKAAPGAAERAATVGAAGGRAGTGGPIDVPPIPDKPVVPEMPKKKGLDDLQDMGEAIEANTIANLGRKFARLPVIRTIIGSLNPAALADTVEAKAVVGRNILHFEGNQKAEQATSTLLQLGRQEQVFGKVGSEGSFIEGPLKGMFPNDVRTYSKRADIRKLMTPEQQAWMDAAQELEAQKLVFLKKHGIDVKELAYGEGGSYAGRRVSAKIVNGEVIEFGFTGGKKPKPGRKLSQTQSRFFRTQKEGAEAGHQYLTEDEALLLNIKAAYRRVADKKFAEYLIDKSPHLRRGLRRKSGEESAFKMLYENSDFKKVYFNEEDGANKIRQLLRKELDTAIPQLTPGLNTMGKVNALVRFMELNADAGQFMIQLFYLGGSHPTVWGKAINGFVRGFIDVASGRNVYHENLIANNRELLARHRGLITSIKGSEYTEAAERGGLLESIPIGGRAITKVINPFARAFNAAMDTAGIELAKSLEMTLKPKTAKEFADIDAFINQIRGLASSARMGVSPQMRAIENSLLLAPRYNRSIAALLWDTVGDWKFAKGGHRGTLSRQALRRSITGILFLGIAFKIAEYQNITEEKDRTKAGMWKHVEKFISPTSPQFFTFEVGGTNIGPGTKIRSLIALFGKSGSAAITEPSSLLEISNRNPFIRFGRGNAAPVISDTWDIFSGHNYMGEPTGWRDGWDEGFIDNIKKSGEKVLLPDIMPIWAQAVLLESGGAGQRASRGAVEFFGGRAYPLRREQLAQNIAEREGLGDYEELDARAKHLIDRLVAEEMEAAGREKYTGKLGPKYQQKDDADTDLLMELQAIAEKRLTGSMDSADYNPVSARKDYNKSRGVHRGYLYGVKWDEEKGRTIGGLLEELYDMDKEQEEPDRGTKEHLVWRYGQTFEEATNPETGKLDFDTLDKVQGKFWASLRPSQADTLLRNIRVLEGEYDNRIQNLADAGRYAGSVKMVLDGEKVGYYDLEDHKSVEAYIASVTGVSIILIQEYLDKTLSERDALRKSEKGELIGKALDRASRKNGILWRLRANFVNNAPKGWKQAMFEAGYSYQGKKDIEKEVFAKIKAGTRVAKLNYKKLYRDRLLI